MSHNEHAEQPSRIDIALTVSIIPRDWASEFGLDPSEAEDDAAILLRDTAEAAVEEYLRQVGLWVVPGA